MEITIGICAEEIKEILVEHIKTKGFDVTEDDISFVIGKEESVTGNTKKIKHALITSTKPRTLYPSRSFIFYLYE